MEKNLNKNKQVLTKEKKAEKDLGYSYFSILLNKPFGSLDELKKAENEFKIEEAKKEEAALAKKDACNIVNTAIDVYEEGKVKCNDLIAKAYNEYKAQVSAAEKDLAVLEKDASEKLRKWFKYHPGQGFHYTYKSKDGKITKNYNYYNNRYDIFDSYDKFVKLLNDLWF